jgi:hypothetical protein
VSKLAPPSSEPELRHQSIDESFHHETDAREDECESGGDEWCLPRDQCESAECEDETDDSERPESSKHTITFTCRVKSPVIDGRVKSPVIDGRVKAWVSTVASRRIVAAT